MAEIDKTLPNIMTQLTPEQETEQVIADTEILNPSGETEVLENEDGSVDINLIQTHYKIFKQITMQILQSL